MFVHYVCLVFFTFSCGQALANATDIQGDCAPAVHSGCKFFSQYMQLWCDASNVSEIPDPATIRSFGPAKFATTLYINRSCITVINTENLNKYGDLKLVDFNNNLIETLSDFTFFLCKKLKTIKLSYNRIEVVGPKVFAGLKRLKVLNLNQNELSVLPEKLFNELTRLRVLDLSSNKLSHITTRIFQNLLFLKSLDLSKNCLKTLTMWNLRGLPQLRSLNLRGNAINRVERYAFFSCPGLQTVDLRENAITCFDERLFEKSEISTILLNDNQIQIPKPNWYRNLPRSNQRKFIQDVESITANNKWMCDCNVLPYQHFLSVELKDVDFWVRKLDIECSGPAAFKGQMLSNISAPTINQYYNNTCHSLLHFKWDPCFAKHPSVGTKIHATPARTTKMQTTNSIFGVEPTLQTVLKNKSPNLEHLQYASFVIMCLLVGAFFVALVLLLGMFHQNRKETRQQYAKETCFQTDESVVFVGSRSSFQDSV